MNSGEKFELIVKEICNKLSAKERLNAEISTRVNMIGIDGTTHEIDVLYSFEELGMHYQVAIECKNWESPIRVGELREFSYKLDQIGGINGIFISAQSEFQSGAKKVSQFKGIKLLKYDELDYFNNSNYSKYLKPDFETIGDPFWMMINHKVSRSLEQNCIKDKVVDLFFSKKQANDYRKKYYSKNNNIKVVGVSQDHLKELKGLFLNDNVRFYLMDDFLGKVCLEESDFDLYIR